MTAQCRQRRAFTLIEAIIAIVVLSISVPPMFWAIRQAHINRVNPEMISRARWLATEKIEAIIADRHSTTRGYSYLNTTNYPAEPSITGFPGFTRSVSFAETGVDLTTAASGYTKITVTVGWTDATATARSLSINTVLTDY